MESDESVERVVNQYAGDYEIIRLLQEGGQGSVYIGSKNGIPYALKVYFPGKLKQIAFYKEKEILSRLKFPYIINMVDSHPKATIKLIHEPQVIQRHLLVLQLAQVDLCMFFDAGLVPFKPDACLAYSKQLISALKYLDSQNVSHRDIKLENILLDKDFKLKISDFGLSTDSKGYEGDYKLRSIVGRQGFQPPEMKNQEYNGLKADIFAVGVVIFMMFVGKPPFFGTWFGQYQYKLYELIKLKRLQKFWQRHQKNKPLPFPLPFKQIMNRFFCADPLQRPTFEELEKDEWLNGQTMTDEQLKSYMSEKMNKLQQKKQELRQIAKIKKKLYEERIRKQEEIFQIVRGVDDDQSSQYKFAINYLNLDIIKTQDLPCYKKKKAVYVRQNVAFIISWLKDHLNTFFKEEETFMNYCEEDIRPQQFKLELIEDKKQISIKLYFQIGEEEQIQLELRGQLHRSDKDSVGVDWIRVDGHDFWLSCVESKLNSCLQAIA